MIHPGANINTIADFFNDLVNHSDERGLQAAHEVIRSRVNDRHLQQGLTLAADGNHPSIVSRYLSETLPHNWDKDMVHRIRDAVEMWQSGKTAEQILECFGQNYSVSQRSIG